MATSRRRGALRLCLTALGLLLTASMTAACGGGTPSVDVVGAQAAPGAQSPATDPAAGDQYPADPPAPSVYRPVVRDGRTPHPTVRPLANAAGVARSVQYGDGVVVRVDRVRHAVENGQGPGVLRGRPRTELLLTVVNRSTAAVDLGQVVVTTVYGSPARLAAPVYEEGVEDFSGTVRPGGTATATYMFSVPAGVAGRVAVIVDLDARHEAARLTVGE